MTKCKHSLKVAIEALQLKYATKRCNDERCKRDQRNNVFELAKALVAWSQGKCKRAQVIAREHGVHQELSK